MWRAPAQTVFVIFFEGSNTLPLRKNISNPKGETYREPWRIHNQPELAPIFRYQCSGDSLLGRSRVIGRILFWRSEINPGWWDQNGGCFSPTGEESPRGESDVLQFLGFPVGKEEPTWPKIDSLLMSLDLWDPAYILVWLTASFGPYPASSGSYGSKLLGEWTVCRTDSSWKLPGHWVQLPPATTGWCILQMVHWLSCIRFNGPKKDWLIPICLYASLSSSQH